MNRYYSQKQLTFSESTLKMGWENRQLGIKAADHILGFIGPYQSLNTLKGEISYCPNTLDKMGHIRVKHLNISKTEGILRLRLLLSIIRDQLGNGFSRHQNIITHQGLPMNLCHIRQVKKQIIFHIGIFIQDLDPPKTQVSLDDLDIPPKEFILNCMDDYSKEIQNITSLCKTT